MLEPFIMDVVPNRRWTTPALCLIIAVSLIMIFSGNLDGAAAWANIIALPVAIIGLTFTLRGAFSAERGQSRAGDGPNGGAPVVNQTGYALKGDQVNVAGDYIRGRPDSDGR